LRRAQRRHPGDVWLTHLLANQLFLKQPRNNEEAAGFFRALVALRPNSPWLHRLLGVLMDQCGKLDDTIAYFRRAIELEPNHCKDYWLLARVLARTGLKEEALAWARKANALRPDDINRRIAMGIAFTSMGQLLPARSPPWGG
jgi:tetratricopeptide (TPR) repeat protein